MKIKPGYSTIGLALLLLAVWSASRNSTVAHPGGLNADGCHTNRTTGEYHCHNKPKVEAKPKPAEAPASTEYKRSLYRHWVDADRDCQNTRQEVLIIESRISAKLDEKGCKVISGEWYDPYTDQVFTDPRKLDIDHFIPLKEVHLSGGDAWDAARRKAYANDLNDPQTLIAVAAGANRSKGAKDPAQWMPPNKAYHCEYVATWVAVKQEWGLTMDQAEENTIERVLASCPQ